MTPDNEPYDNVLLTLDELRNIPGFENISEEQGKEFIDTIAIFCEIAVSVYLSQKKSCSDEEHYL